MSILDFLGAKNDELVATAGARRCKKLIRS